MATPTRTLSLVCLLLLAFATPAAAVTLTTPFLITGTGACVVTNIGTKPITASVTIVDAVGGVVTPASNTCTGPIAAKTTCAVATGPLDVAIVPNGFHCTVTTSSGKVRVVAAAQQGMLPATK